MIRATHGAVELAASKQRAAVEDALRQAIGASPAGGGSVTPIARARTRMRRAPWIVAGTTTLVAAAAIAMLWLRTPGGAGRGNPVARRAVPEEWTSRPADSLVGPIARDHAGDAGARIDAIFADRLDGFRTRRLARKGKP